LAALKLKEGDKVEEAVKDLVKKAPAEGQAKVHFDAETSGDVKIHKIDVQSDFDEKTRAMLGSHPLYVAFRPDAAFVSGGANGLHAIQDALKGEPKPAPAGLFEISMSHLAPLILAQSGKNPEEAKKQIQEVFKGDNDKIRVTLEGGKLAKINFEMGAAVIKVAPMLEKHEQRTFKEVGKEIKAPKKKPKKEKEKDKDKEEDKN
jgi:hypothetical protein